MARFVKFALILVPSSFSFPCDPVRPGEPVALNPIRGREIVEIASGLHSPRRAEARRRLLAIGVRALGPLVGLMKSQNDEARFETLRQVVAELRREVRIRHIVVGTRRLARRLVALVRVGTPFERLARTYSKAPSAAGGGELGYIGRGTMEQGFEETAFALEVGRVGGPVRTRCGWHAIECLGIRTRLPGRSSPGAPGTADRAASVDGRSPAGRLVGLLGSPSWRERRRAQKALLSMGAAAVASVKKGLHSPDLEIRWRCRRIWKRLRWTLVVPAAMQRKLLPVLERGDARELATLAAGLRHAGTQVLPLLSELLSDERPEVAEAAARSLAAVTVEGRSRSPREEPAGARVLVRALDRKHPRVVQAALAALLAVTGKRALGGPLRARVVAAARRLQGRPEPSLKVGGLELLASHDPDGVPAHLEIALKGPHAAVRGAAVRLAGRHRVHGLIGALARAFGGDDRALSSAVAEVLIAWEPHIRDPEALLPVARAAIRLEPARLFFALQILRPFDSPRFVPAFVKGFGAENRQIAGLAERWLFRHPHPSTAVLFARLFPRLAPERRHAAYQILGRIGTPAAGATLVGALADLENLEVIERSLSGRVLPQHVPALLAAVVSGRSAPRVRAAARILIDDAPAAVRAYGFILGLESAREPVRKHCWARLEASGWQPRTGRAGLERIWLARHGEELAGKLAALRSGTPAQRWGAAGELARFPYPLVIRSLRARLAEEKLPWVASRIERTLATMGLR